MSNTSSSCHHPTRRRVCWTRCPQERIRSARWRSPSKPQARTPALTRRRLRAWNRTGPQTRWELPWAAWPAPALSSILSSGLSKAKRSRRCCKLLQFKGFIRDSDINKAATKLSCCVLRLVSLIINEISTLDFYYNFFILRKHFGAYHHRQLIQVESQIKIKIKLW